MKTLGISDLQWIDSYFHHIRKYLFFRREDGVLIFPPNRVTRLNGTGQELLSHLFSGRSIASFPGLNGADRCRDVNVFFSNLKAFYEDQSINLDQAEAVERRPYDFQFTRLPILGEIALTYRCNNRCLFCYAGCGKESPAAQGTPKELTTRGFKKIIRIFRDEARIPFFSFTGGEPLLRGDLESLISYAEKRGLRTNLITNGTLATEQRSRKLYRAGLRTAQVSIEAPEAELHNRLTGSSSFQKTCQGIAALKSAGIKVQTNTTLTALNVDSTEKMPAFLKELGIDRFSMNLFIPTEKSPGNDKLFLSYSQIGPVVDRVRKEAARLSMTFYWYSPLPHCHFNPLSRGMGNKSCAAMDGLISVTPTGDIQPCSSYAESMGSLLSGKFQDIWFSKRAGFFKEKRYAPEECSGCDRFIACQAACPLYWQYAGTCEINKREALRCP